VVTVADAKWLVARLRDAPEAKSQIAFADVIVLNKTDLVTPAELAEVEGRIRAINPYAALHRTVNADVPLQAVLEKNAFDLERILEIEPDFLAAEEHDHHHDHHHHDHDHGLTHHHDEDIGSVAIRHAGEVDPERFVPWLNELVQRDGPDILRCKGIVAFEDEPRRFVFQGVHQILDGDLQREWKPDEKRSSRLVFIGRKLKEAEIREGFAKCVVGGSD